MLSQVKVTEEGLNEFFDVVESGEEISLEPSEDFNLAVKSKVCETIAPIYAHFGRFDGAFAAGFEYGVAYMRWAEKKKAEALDKSNIS